MYSKYKCPLKQTYSKTSKKFQSLSQSSESKLYLQLNLKFSCETSENTCNRLIYALKLNNSNNHVTKLLSTNLKPSQTETELK